LIFKCVGFRRDRDLLLGPRQVLLLRIPARLSASDSEKVWPLSLEKFGPIRRDPDVAVSWLVAGVRFGFRRLLLGTPAGPPAGGRRADCIGEGQRGAVNEPREDVALPAWAGVI